MARQSLTPRSAADVADIVRRSIGIHSPRTIFDQYVLATARDIEHLVPAEHCDDVFRTINGWIAATVVVGGRVVGTWSAEKGTITLALWDDAPKKALDREVDRVTGLLRVAPDLQEDR